MWGGGGGAGGCWCHSGGMKGVLVPGPWRDSPSSGPQPHPKPSSPLHRPILNVPGTQMFMLTGTADGRPRRGGPSGVPRLVRRGKPGSGCQQVTPCGAGTLGTKRGRSHGQPRETEGGVLIGSPGTLFTVRPPLRKG